MGLLCAKKDLSANEILYMTEELNDFKGGMTENYVNFICWDCWYEIIINSIVNILHF